MDGGYTFAQSLLFQACKPNPQSILDEALVTNRNLAIWSQASMSLFLPEEWNLIVDGQWVDSSPETSTAGMMAVFAKKTRDASAGVAEALALRDALVFLTRESDMRQRGSETVAKREPSATEVGVLRKKVNNESVEIRNDSVSIAEVLSGQARTNIQSEFSDAKACLTFFRTCS